LRKALKSAFSIKRLNTARELKSVYHVPQIYNTLTEERTSTYSININHTTMSTLLTSSVLIVPYIGQCELGIHARIALRTDELSHFLSLTYKVLTTTQPPYFHNLISTQRPRSTRSSSVVTLARPPSSSSLNITDRSFSCASPCLWNQLPLSLRKPHSGTSSSISY